MPTLTRFLFFLMMLIGLVFGIIYALGNFVEPQTGEISHRIDAERLNFD